MVNLTKIFAYFIILRRSLEMLERVSKDPFVTEDFIDILVDIWPDFITHEHEMIKLPEVLGVLSNSVATEEYADKLKSLRNSTSGASNDLTTLLERAIKTAEQNIVRMKHTRREMYHALSVSLD